MATLIRRSHPLVHDISTFRITIPFPASPQEHQDVPQCRAAAGHAHAACGRALVRISSKWFEGCYGVVLRGGCRDKVATFSLLKFPRRPALDSMKALCQLVFIGSCIRVPLIEKASPLTSVFFAGTLPTRPPSATTSARRWPSTAAVQKKWATTSGAHPPLFVLLP